MSRHARIDFSRVLGPWAVGILALSVAFAMSGLVGGGAVLLTSGSDAPRVLVTGALLLLPVLLGYVSRASESESSGTAYAIVRGDGGSVRLFATGWLCIGGYLCLAALMIDAVSVRVGGLLESYLGRDVPDLAIVAPVTAMAVLSQVVSPVEHLRTRVLVAGAALGAAVVLILGVVIWPPEAVPGVELPTLPSRHYLTGAALLGGVLWFVDVALDYRRMYRGDDRSLAAVMTICWCVAIAVTTVMSAIVLAQPDLFVRLRGVTAGSWSHDNVRIGGLVVTLVLCWVTVSKAFSRLLRLSGSMARDGSVPSLFEDVDAEDRAPVAFIMLFGTIAGVLALLAPLGVLVGVCSVTFFWSAGIAFLSRLRRGKPERPPAFALPLYPLFPVVALFVCAFFSMIVPANAPLVTLLWLLAGFGTRLVYRRDVAELGGAPEIEEADDEDTPVPDTETVYRVLVCLSPASDVPALLQLGTDMARARGGDVVVLRVVALLERLPRSDVRAIARRQWRALRATVREVIGDAPDVYPIVRIATSEAGGFVDAAGAHEADLVLMDTPRRRGAAESEHEAAVDLVFAATTRAVALVHGDVPAKIRRVVAAVSSGPDTPAVLSLGETLAKARGGELVALSVTGQRQSADDAETAVARQVAEVGIEARAISTQDDDPAAGIVRVAGANDVVVMGTTRDRALTHAGTSGLWRDVIDDVPGAAILVRRAERRRMGWVRELWELAFATLPTLTVGERAEVYAQMRHSARAGVDFYVLIVISSAIATFGLFQDSAAVIIGAMLVAPLMSPIVAIAQGIVQGNMRMIRKGLASTMKGTLVAIVVSAFFTLAMPEGAPSGQILARTEPTLLDLGVGLAAGAAAAYGISRKSVAAALPGVAIAVALVPPLCVVGYGLGANHLEIAMGASLLYLTNLVAIVFVAAVLFLLLGFYPRQAERRRAVRGAVLASIAGVLLLSVPLALSSWETSSVGRIEVRVADSFRREARARALQLDDVTVERVDGEYLVRATVYAPIDFAKDEITAFLAAVEKESEADVRLEIRLLRAEVIVQGGDD